jgi:hypothetical protein
MANYVNIFKILNRQQLALTILKSIASIVICYSTYVILKLKDFENLIPSIIIADLILKKILTQSRIYSLNHFLYLQVRKRTLFLYFLFDAFLSVSNLFFLICSLYLIVFKAPHSSENLKIIIVLFFSNTLIERSSNLIQYRTFFYLTSIFLIYLTLLCYLNTISITFILYTQLLQVLLLYIAFKKYILTI